MAFPCLGVGTLAIWIWSWSVARGIMSRTCSSVVGARFFGEYVFSFSIGSSSVIQCILF